MDNLCALIILILSISLILIETAVPIILILLLGFVLLMLASPGWMNFVFMGLIYRRNPLVKPFYEQVVEVAEARGRKIARTIRWPVYILVFIVFIAGFSRYFPLHDNMQEPLFKETLPKVCLAFGIIFIGYGVLLSGISSAVYLEEMRNNKVTNRGVEIFLLGSYLQHILYVVVIITACVMGLHFWHASLNKLLPLFSSLEDKLAPYGMPKNHYLGLLNMIESAYTGFRVEFQNWGIIGFLVIFAGFAVPYIGFKGRRYGIIFVSIFLGNAVFSYLISLLIRKFIGSEATGVFLSVYLFCGLISYTVFHLIKSISLTKASVCSHCQTENTIDSKYCKGCGREIVSA